MNIVLERHEVEKIIQEYVQSKLSEGQEAGTVMMTTNDGTFTSITVGLKSVTVDITKATPHRSLDKREIDLSTHRSLNV